MDDSDRWVFCSFHIEEWVDAELPLSAVPNKEYTTKDGRRVKFLSKQGHWFHCEIWC